MNYKTDNQQCDICAGNGKCFSCGGHNYDEMITGDRLRNAFYDTLKKGKLYKLTYNRVNQSLMIEEDWLVFGQIIDYANQFRIVQKESKPFNFYDKTYREILGNIGFIMASHVIISEDDYSRLVTCRMNNE